MMRILPFSGLARLLALPLLLLLFAGSATAQGLSALARLDLAGSLVRVTDGMLELRLAISQPVPWRVRLMDGPPRLVIDAREIDWAGVATLAPDDLALRAGSFRPGWSRLVVELPGPLSVALSEMTTGPQGTLIRLQLVPTDLESFASAAARPDLPEWSAPEPADLPATDLEGKGPLIVVLDPGHGGIDPGAERDGATEAELMLTFARELKEILLRDGRFSVVLTREEDVFVPLETRISIARAAGASLFLSLHADALAEGDAQGATVYTLSEEATDAATAALAERHDRDDLLAGIDLTEQDDLVAEVLMDMARTDTAPRTARLAETIVAAIKRAEIRMHRRPLQTGGFSVLKSPDIPSVLLELGFLSSDRDYSRLSDPDWRGKMAEAILQAIILWSEDEATRRGMAAP